MAGFAYVNQVQDRATQQALIAANELITKLTARIAALESSVLKVTNGQVNVGGARITNVGDPKAETDAATVNFVRQIAEAQVESFG